MDTTKLDFVDIRLTGGDFLHSIRWANVQDIEDHTENTTEPFFVLTMANGTEYTVKDPNSFEGIRARRKDRH